MSTDHAQPIYVEATVFAVSRHSSRIFHFMQGGEKKFCYYAGDSAGLLPMVAGQRVMMQGQWSRTVLQVFEAVAIMTDAGESLVQTPPRSPPAGADLQSA